LAVCHAKELNTAVNHPVGDNARKGAVRRRSQLKTKVDGEAHWTKRSLTSGRFMDQKNATAKAFSAPRKSQLSPGNAQLELFSNEAGGLQGLRYQSDFVSSDEEKALIGRVRALPLAPFQFGGLGDGNRHKDAWTTTINSRRARPPYQPAARFLRWIALRSKKSAWLTSAETVDC
jgi:hypothetical protein